MRIFAERHNRKAIELEESGNRPEAIRLYRKAIDSDASWSTPWYNLGLLYKRQGQWSESFDCNLKAVALNPSDEDAWWNLGIAATALENWPEARRAWRACGIPLDEEDGPIELNFGLTPVRLNPDGEVVWCDRIDPARAVIRSIPLPESGHHYGDLLLHDGEPRGYRVLGGVELPVFNELQILRRSDYGTFEIHLNCPDEFETGELIDFLDGSGMPAEEWSSGIRSICRACSEGLPPDAAHTHPPEPDGSIRIGIAAKSESELRRAMSEWVESHPQTKIIELV
ncbi:MAG: tetratricopeptide repeat protein [Acidobacteriota bacterium]|nr:MAG: tetratricopeptide repeat protein [Acidobacteriota bacterium]